MKLAAWTVCSSLYLAAASVAIEADAAVEDLALKLALELSPSASEDPDPFSTGQPLPLKFAGELNEPVPGSAPPAKAESVNPQTVLYAVRINGQNVGEALLLRAADGSLLARQTDLDAWRLRLPDASPILFKGESYYSLAAYQGSRLSMDEKRQELTLELAPKYFIATVLGQVSAAAVPSAPPGVGGFGNYDLFYSATSGSKRLDGQFEAGVFNRLGVGVSGFLAQDIGRESRMIRLDTTWTRDFPSDIRTLTLGDAIGGSGIWGRPVRYGGVRYGTNFATRPGFITFPLPGLVGESALPTTTELYVDGVLRQRGSLPPGPFQISNLPVITGQGDVRLVVRDLLGREQVISQPYYASSLLLREGLIDESNEIGFVRNDFGIRSNDYGRFVATVQRRKGFSDYFTGEARAEILRDQQTAGAGGSIAFPALGVFTAAAAISRSADGYGELLFTAFERQIARGVSFGLRSQWTTPKFTQLGLQPGQPAPVRVMSANIGVFSGTYGSLGLAYLRQDNRDISGSEIASASYTLSVGKSAALIVSAFKTLSGERSQALAVTLSAGFGERSSASLTYVAQANANQAVAEIQENLPAGTGTGYRVLAGTGNAGERLEVGFAAQTDAGTYVVEAGRFGDVVSYRASASGGVAFLDGRAYLLRRVTDSFGVVLVPDFANVGIYLHNQLVARTDARGYAMLPRLLAYQDNPVRIGIDDLPLEAQFDVTQINAVPYFRSGVLLKFPVERSNGALLRVVLTDGAPMPVGSTVSIVGQAEQFLVAERGEVYVTGLMEKNRLRASWREQSCEFGVDFGKGLGPVPKLGPYICAGVHR